MGHWGIYRPDYIGNRQKTPHLHCLLDGGDYNPWSDRQSGPMIFAGRSSAVYHTQTAQATFPDLLWCSSHA
jgi:hypothetical protein